MQRSPELTCFCGNLSESVAEEHLWELMVQVGVVRSVSIPTDKVTGRRQNYGFVEFATAADAEYAARVMNMVRLFGKPLRVHRSQRDRKDLDVGANLFIGGLDGTVDEKVLYDTFSAFGNVIGAPHVQSDPVSGESKGFGFVSFDSFEASDMAIECMDNQFLGSQQIRVQYAYKKDAKGERHGSQAERILAAAGRAAAPQPHMTFASGPAGAAPPPPRPPPPPLRQQVPPPLPSPYLPPGAPGLRAAPPPLPQGPPPLPQGPPPLPAARGAFPGPARGPATGTMAMPAGPPPMPPRPR